MNIVRIQGEAERYQGVYYEFDRDSSPLGEGGMGRIYHGFRVDERGFRTTVAIKEIHQNIAHDPQLIERAMRESAIQINHDNLLRMYGFVTNIEFDPIHNANLPHYYMIMERLIGVDLSEILTGHLNDNSGMQIPLAASIHSAYTNPEEKDQSIMYVIRSVLFGLMALHNNGYIHRDIDPSNIMVTIDNKIKLIDFGVCKHVSYMAAPEKKLTSAGSFIGKVSYAAPELARGDVEHQDVTTDIYALGILIYKLCVGKLPFDGPDHEVLNAHITKKVPVENIANKDIRRIVEKATQKIQSKRYSSAAEMIADIEKITYKKTTTAGGNTRIETSRQSEWSAKAVAICWSLGAIASFVLGIILKNNL